MNILTFFRQSKVKYSLSSEIKFFCVKIEFGFKLILHLKMKRLEQRDFLNFKVTVQGLELDQSL